MSSGSENARSKVYVDYVAMLNHLAKKGRDESLNAAPFYKKAAELYVEMPAGIEKEALRKWPSQLTNKEHDLLKQWVKSNANALVQLEYGTHKPYYWNQYAIRSVWSADTLPYLPTLKFLIYASLFQGKQSVMEKGISIESVDSFFVCIRFGLHLTQAPTLTEQLVGETVMDFTVQELFLCVAKMDIDRTALDLLESRLRDQFSKIHKQQLNLEVEKFQHLEVVQMVFQGMEENSMLTAESEMFLASRGARYEYIETLTRSKTMRDIEAAFTYCKEFLTLSPWQMKEKGFNFWEDLHKKTGKNPLVELHMFNVPAVARARAHRGANRDAFIIALALLRYRHDRGRLPKDLHELLSDDYLPQLPMDPYSDGPLIYKKMGGDFLLYSLGEDFDDDSGKHGRWGWNEKDGDYVFWPVQMESAEK